MTTLVVSDLHLGSRARADLLRKPHLRGRLIEALRDCERLVLLGDALELRQGPLREALAAARPFFAQAGAALGADGEIVLVPGNHDHALVAPWLERRHRDELPPPLGLAQQATWAPSDAVAALAEAAAPARLTLAYPGVWLRDDVYAMHGHYLDRHITVPTLERLSAGAMGRIVGALPERCAAPDDYERALAPIYAWSTTLAQHADDEATGTYAVSLRAYRTLAGNGHRPLRRRALAALFPLSVLAVNRAGLGPVRADISGAELGRAGVRAMGEAVDLLGIGAAHVLFGHTHRAGPRPDDAPAEWTTPAGVRLHNSGCWVYERQFLSETPYASPYWPGTAIRVDESGPPVALRVLDGLGPADL
ncbi:MAG TPA: metallophosphoesterase [Conexibacter sp.]|nr:metallophosphoesterase [Conexibacter sp.]